MDKPVKEMSDRDLLEESVVLMRQTRDTVNTFLESMSQNPMLRTMAGMFARNGRE